LVEKKLAAYELNDEQKNNKIQKLTEEKEEAVKFAQEYKNKLGEFETKFKEYRDEKTQIIEKLQSDLSEQNECFKSLLSNYKELESENVKLKSQIEDEHISCITQIKNKRLELVLQEKFEIEAEKNFLKEQLKILKEENEIITVKFQNFIGAQNIRIDFKELKQNLEISQNNNKLLKASLSESSQRIRSLEKNYDKKIDFLKANLRKKCSKIKILDNKIKSLEKDKLSFQTNITESLVIEDNDYNLKTKDETISTYLNKIKKMEIELNAVKTSNSKMKQVINQLLDPSFVEQH